MSEKLGRKFRPSNADRYLNCPASVVVSQDLERDTSVYADTGSVVHALADNCLATGKKPEDFMGEKLCADRDIDIPVDDSMLDGARMYLDWIANQHFDEISSEQMFTFKWVKNPDGETTVGYADLVAYSQDFDELVVADYKNGVMPVPDNSLQFAVYALGAMERREKVNSIKTVRIQPNVMQGARIGEHVWKKGDLIKLKAEIKFTVKWVKNTKPEDVKDKDFCEGHWCKFCPAAKSNRCPAKAKAFFNLIDVDKPLDPPSVLDEEKMKMIILRRTELKKYVDDVYNHYFKEAYVNGKTTEGLKLVEGRSKPRAWKKDIPEVEIASDLREMGMLEDEYYPKKLATPAQAKKILKDRFKELEDILTPAEKSVELVSEDDPRKTVGGADFFPEESDSKTNSGF